ncbi:hypothetical protein [Halochromatium roseum]|uniref:hypothetical protein n=1 Tax=Halochromatium roseum TaxID=391920 RepID=UPI001913521B|nr:hypothetical protein [Halochromatium roseum]
MSSTDSALILQDLAALYLLPRRQRLDPFFTASRQRFGVIAEHLLAMDAPMLV